MTFSEKLNQKAKTLEDLCKEVYDKCRYPSCEECRQRKVVPLEVAKGLEGRLTTINTLIDNAPIPKPVLKDGFAKFVNAKEFEPWLGRLREASGSSEKLSVEEEADVKESLKEISEGKAKKFTDANEMLQDLKKREAVEQK